jgi:hypothetical protein
MNARWDFHARLNSRTEVPSWTGAAGNKRLAVLGKYLQ